MATDPRFNVKPCPPTYAGKSAVTNAASANSRGNFFRGIQKAGNLEVLNDIGANQIGKGLRTIASVSNSIRTGCGALPTAIGGIIGSGADAIAAAGERGTNWVLEQVGMNLTTVDVVRAFNPQVANQAYGQAKQIFEKASQGNFRIEDIPFVFQDLQNLERLGRGIFTPTTWLERNKATAVCEASPYAIDLVQRHPKFKFLFVVEFGFYPEFDSLKNLQFPFVIKKTTRPSIKYDMEDVNYYNYRTKLITKTLFDEMSMTFYDDNQNEAMDFIVSYFRALTPIANKFSNVNNGSGFNPNNYIYEGIYPGSDENSDSVYSSNIQQFTNNGVRENPTTNPTQTGKDFEIPVKNYTATRGLTGNSVGVLQYINLYHFYDWGRKLNSYSFVNPRITNISMDELAMDAGDSLSEISLSFNYDTVIIDTGIDFSKQSTNGNENIGSKIASLQKGAIYTLRSVNNAADNASPPEVPLNLATPPNPADCGPANTQKGNQPVGTTSPLQLSGVGSTPFGGSLFAP